MVDAVKLIRFIMISEAKYRVKKKPVDDFIYHFYDILQEVTFDTGQVLDKIHAKRRAKAKGKGGY